MHRFPFLKRASPSSFLFSSRSTSTSLYSEKFFPSLSLNGCPLFSSNPSHSSSFSSSSSSTSSSSSSGPITAAATFGVSSYSSRIKENIQRGVPRRQGVKANQNQNVSSPSPSPHHPSSNDGEDVAPLPSSSSSPPSSSTDPNFTSLANSALFSLSLSQIPLLTSHNDSVRNWESKLIDGEDVTEVIKMVSPMRNETPLSPPSVLQKIRSDWQCPPLHSLSNGGIFEIPFSAPFHLFPFPLSRITFGLPYRHAPTGSNAIESSFRYFLHSNGNSIELNYFLRFPNSLSILSEIVQKRNKNDFVFSFTLNMVDVVKYFKSEMTHKAQAASTSHHSGISHRSPSPSPSSLQTFEIDVWVPRYLKSICDFFHIKYIDIVIINDIDDPKMSFHKHYDYSFACHTIDLEQKDSENHHQNRNERDTYRKYDFSPLSVSSSPWLTDRTEYIENIFSAMESACELNYCQQYGIYSEKLALPKGHSELISLDKLVKLSREVSLSPDDSSSSSSPSSPSPLRSHFSVVKFPFNIFNSNFLTEKNIKKRKNSSFPNDSSTPSTSSLLTPYEFCLSSNLLLISSSPFQTHSPGGTPLSLTDNCRHTDSYLIHRMDQSMWHMGLLESTFDEIFDPVWRSLQQFLSENPSVPNVHNIDGQWVKLTEIIKESYTKILKNQSFSDRFVYDILTSFDLSLHHTLRTIVESKHLPNKFNNKQFLILEQWMKRYHQWTLIMTDRIVAMTEAAVAPSTEKINSLLLEMHPNFHYFPKLQQKLLYLYLSIRGIHSIHTGDVHVFCGNSNSTQSSSSSSSSSPIDHKWSGKGHSSVYDDFTNELVFESLAEISPQMLKSANERDHPKDQKSMLKYLEDIVVTPHGFHHWIPKPLTLFKEVEAMEILKKINEIFLKTKKQVEEARKTAVAIPDNDTKTPFFI